MAESFVKSFKRDYVHLAQLDSAEVVLKQLPRWFADYNAVHPHKALKMLSPSRVSARNFTPLTVADLAGANPSRHVACRTITVR